MMVSPLRVVVLAFSCHAAQAVSVSPELRRSKASFFMREANQVLQPHYHKHRLEVLNSEVQEQGGHKNLTHQMMAAIRRKDLWSEATTASSQPVYMKADPMKVVAETQEGFVRVKTMRGKEATLFQVEVASPMTILVVFAIMYVPIAAAWINHFRTGRQEKNYVLLLPITLCLTLVGDNFVQKSLAVLMQAPMAITSAQAAGMGVFSAIWCLMDGTSVNLQQAWSPLMMWGLVAIMFTVYQLLNHLVAFYCSLAERTVFTNLCPVASLIFEATVMPTALKAHVTCNGKLALGLLVFGALTFSMAYPDFSTMGIIFASLMVLTVVPYRLAQRYCLNEARMLPVMLLVSYDGFFLMAPSTAIAAVEDQKHYLQTWEGWMSDSSIPLLLFLSMCTFIANHACALMVLQVGSATTLQVYQNLSNFVVVGLGILFFADNVLSSPMVLIGLMICLFAGLWYAIEAQPKKAPEEPKDILQEQPAESMLKAIN